MKFNEETLKQLSALYAESKQINPDHVGIVFNKGELFYAILSRYEADLFTDAYYYYRITQQVISL